MNAPPLQILHVSPHPHWTDPESREETLARREKFQNVGLCPPSHEQFYPALYPTSLRSSIVSTVWIACGDVAIIARSKREFHNGSCKFGFLDKLPPDYK